MKQTKEIEQIIEQSEGGYVFFVSDFATNGNDKYVSRLLSKDFVEMGLLEKISSGIYFKPIRTQFGTLKPSMEDIVYAIAKRDNAHILPTGEVALNRLGFSTQIPMKMVYLTSGSERQLRICGNELVFLHRSPKTFAYKGKFFPILVQALRSIGKDNISERDREITKELLKRFPEQDTIEQDMNLPPLWLKKLLFELRKEALA